MDQQLELLFARIEIECAELAAQAVAQAFEPEPADVAEPEHEPAAA
jgi:hypothetical protein